MKDAVPTDDQVSAAIRAAMRKHRRIESQRDLLDAVRKELGSADHGTSVTASRVRKVALREGLADVEIEYRASAQGLPDVCPVCGGAMDTVTAVGLDGGRREISRGCSLCPFRIQGRPKGPAKYIFIAPRRPVSDTDVRIRKLRRAAGLLNRAKSLITEASAGTELSSRVCYPADTIDSIIGSREEQGSIYNMIADLKAAEDPLWTRPLDSPKKRRGRSRTIVQCSKSL